MRDWNLTGQMHGIEAALIGWATRATFPPGTAEYLRRVIRSGRTRTTIREAFPEVSVPTLNSRAQRAKIASPAALQRRVRDIYLAHLLGERGLTILEASVLLNYSDGGSLARYVRNVHGVSIEEFRSYPVRAARSRFCVIFAPEAEGWNSFRPFGCDLPIGVEGCGNG